MATHITAEPQIGELRYLARLDSAKLPDEYPFGNHSHTAGSTETIEGSDVFIVDGETRSKFNASSMTTSIVLLDQTRMPVSSSLSTNHPLVDLSSAISIQTMAACTLRCPSI